MIEQTLKQKVLDRFEKQYMPEPNTGCWLWLGTYFANGYGSFWNGRRSIGAHRFLYEARKGKIPEGLNVLHKCDTPVCVNPDHLFLGTHADNMRDKVAKNRQARSTKHGRFTHPEKTSKGEKHYKAKITEQHVREIRSSDKKQDELSKTYGISKSAIAHILHNRSWKDVK